ncbi:MAG: hypothetical protein EOO04_06640 [Chitinophagaceae bacterium]|nr:MAG: hypothetical protein EOO04_06640 [Chitinophagaceae bacterium]
MTSPKDIYTANLAACNGRLQKLRTQLSILAVLRLVFFVVAAWLIYRALTGNNGLPTALVSAVLFIVSVRFALTLQDRKRLQEKLVFVNQNELDILQGNKNRFSNGTGFINPNDYSADLDIFGTGSLYGLLNRTTTSLGSIKLAAALTGSLPGEPEIIATQDALKELSHQTSVRQLITAHGLLHEEKSGTLTEIKAWLQEPNRMRSLKWLHVVRFLLPAYNIWALYHFLDTDNNGPLLMGLAVAFTVVFSFSRYIFSQHKLVTKKQAILDQYSAVLKNFDRVEAGNSNLLKELKSGAENAGNSMYRLARLAAAFDQRLNLVVLLLLNGLLLYDIQCMLQLEKWKEANRSHFDDWTNMVGSIELLNSLGGFTFNNPGYAFPLVTPGMRIEAVDLSHPLIPGDAGVPNSITTGRNEQLIVLTGSNMSGKTTFLRTLGVNLVLAQCGAPVCAKHFVFKPMMILTSIRVGDSLQENTSYFMAELKKLRSIIDSLESGRPALVLIDEILRGTNSDDKTHGSEQFIKKLLHYNCLTLFATHDLSLSVLAEELPGRVSNYCFESVIENGELIFDYTLQHGVARNKNASFLMQKMGII